MIIVVAVLLALGGAACGAILAVQRVKRGGLGLQIKNHQWHTTTLAGSVDADALTRARIAVAGLLALDKREAIYFNATRDEAGKPITSDGVYEIRGRVPDARWWSITAYGEDHFLIANQPGIYSLQPDTVALRDDGSFIATLSRMPAGNAWLPSGMPNGEVKRVALSLRLYNVPNSVMNDLAGVELPRIVRVG